MSNFVTLLVEDDALEREVLADVLKDEGFEVIECTTGEAAELIIASTGTELQALVTDHNLAGAMSGAALARYARSRHPHMNIIIMSGRTVDPSQSVQCSCRSLSRLRSCWTQSAIKKCGASLQRSRAYPTPSVTPPIPCGQRRLNCRPYRLPSKVLLLRCSGAWSSNAPHSD